MSPIFSFRNNENYNQQIDQSIEKFNKSIANVKPILSAYLKAKAAQEVRANLGFFGRMFCSYQPILPSLLALSEKAREIQKEITTLSASISQNQNQEIDIQVRVKAELAMTTSKAFELIHKVKTGLEEAKANVHEGKISPETAIKFTNEMKEWGSLPDFPINLPTTDPIDANRGRGLGALSYKTYFRGAVFLGGLAFLIENPKRFLKGLYLLPISCCFSYSRRVIVKESLEIIKGVVDLTIGAFNTNFTGNIGDPIISLSEPIEVIEKKALEEEARKKIHREIALKVGMIGGFILGITGTYFIYGEIKSNFREIMRNVSSLNPIPLIRRSANEIGESISRSIQFINSTKEGFESVVINSSPFITAGAEQFKEIIFSLGSAIDWSIKNLKR